MIGRRVNLIILNVGVYNMHLQVGGSLVQVQTGESGNIFILRHNTSRGRVTSNEEPIH